MNPNFSNSPWIRGAPHPFSRAILRTRSRTSRPTAARPGDLFRLESHLQYSAKPARCHPITVSGFTMTTASAHLGEAQEICLGATGWAHGLR